MKKNEEPKTVDLNAHPARAFGYCGLFNTPDRIDWEHLYSYLPPQGTMDRPKAMTALHMLANRYALDLYEATKEIEILKARVKILKDKLKGEM